ncbi:branched-chain amino acid ABC transporter permease [Halomarina ordinaria]|uniref:Branched-chain amino acid ABC transporter permease n=1 Tax=Halomarina ordinaria TaxID=3033939 RepID=A0ABD5UEB2_9EURY|nr:branched-chain amino acid ABC transporter permease [Halomarina sp. PSRA2]
MLHLAVQSGVLEPLRELFGDLIGLNPVLLQLLVFGLLLGGIYALAALGLTMIFGVMDIVNFAHGSFLVLGMFSSWWVSSTFGVSPFLTIIVSVVLLFVLGVALSVLTIEPIIEKPEENQFIVTLGISFIIIALLEIAFGADSRSLGIQLGNYQVLGASIPRAQLYALVIALLSIVACWAFLYYTKLGRALRATADNRDAAWYMGINVPRIDHLTFGLGAALAGLGGGAIVLFSPVDPFAGETYLVKAFVIVVLGGLGSFPGALVGGLVIGLIEVYGSYYLPGTVYEIVIFGMFVVLLYVKPTGLFGAEEVSR